MELSNDVTTVLMDNATTDTSEVFSPDVNDVTHEGSSVTRGSRYLDISTFLTLWPTSLTATTAAVLFSAAVANLWILTAWIRTPSVWKSSFHILLMNHALANFLLACVPYPILVYRMTTLTLEGSSTQTLLCRTLSTSLMWLVFIVLLSIGFIAINRALACYPNFKLGSKLRGTNATLRVIGCTWVIVTIWLGVAASDIYAWDRVFVCIPLVQLTRTFADPEEALRGEKLRLVVSSSFSAVALVTLIVCCSGYGLISRHLYAKRYQFTSVSSDTAARKLQNMKRSLLVIVATFTVFTVCWLPSALSISYDAQILRYNPLLMALPLFETLLTPLLYIFTLPVFKVGACLRKRKVAANSQALPVSQVRQRAVGATTDRSASTLITGNTVQMTSQLQKSS